MAYASTALSVERLLQMSQQELDALFTCAAAGAIPEGQAEGTAVIAPGTRAARVISRLVHVFAWQGKVFDPEKGVLRNRILPVGIRAIVAKVYKDTSWLDGKECIVLDYSRTSFVARKIRDEIRAIAPGLYLGKVYWGRRRLIDFVLEFEPAAQPVRA